MTREQHIARLEKSMARWRSLSMDCDGIFDDEYIRYMNILKGLKDGMDYKVTYETPDIGIAMIGAEICNLQRAFDAGAKPKNFTAKDAQREVDFINKQCEKIKSKPDLIEER